jgi:hypothetical protein
MNEGRSDASDEALGRRLARELPRHRAPAHLRAAITQATAGRPQPPGWRAPLLASAATAMALTLLFMTRLPTSLPADPVERLVRAVVAEHTRVTMWGARRPDIIPAVSRESGIGLARSFPGDERLTFLDAEPVYMDRRRGAALHYRDVDGHLITYVVLPGQGVSMPERKRVPMGRFRPALLRDNDFATILWKQGDFVCLLVSDMVSPTDVETFKDYFVRVRSATEPSPAS